MNSLKDRVRVLCFLSSRIVQLFALESSVRGHTCKVQRAARSSVPSDLQDLGPSGTFTCALTPTLSFRHTQTPCSIGTDKERACMCVYMCVGNPMGRNLVSSCPRAINYLLPSTYEHTYVSDSLYFCIHEQTLSIITCSLIRFFAFKYLLLFATSYSLLF